MSAGFFIGWSIATVAMCAFANQLSALSEPPRARSLANAGGDLLVVRGGKLMLLKATDG